MTGGQVSLKNQRIRNRLKTASARWINYRRTRAAKIAGVQRRRDYKEMKTVFNLAGIEVM